MWRILRAGACAVVLSAGPQAIAPAQAGLWEEWQGLTRPEARTTQGQPGRRTVTYTPPGWPQALAADLYLPAASAHRPSPVVLLVPGEDWRRGDKRDLRGLGQTLADRGYAALAVNYRLAPGAHHPAQLQDLQEALRWLRAHAQDLRLDLERLGIWGYSAGGHLAALLAVQPSSDLPPVRVVIAGGAPLDLRVLPEAASGAVQGLLGGTPGELPALYDQASPMAYVRPDLPPFFLYHGTDDTDVAPAQAAAFAAALGDAGVPVELVWLQGLGHDEVAAAAQLRPSALLFLDHHLAEGSGAALTQVAWQGRVPALLVRAHRSVVQRGKGG